MLRTATIGEITRADGRFVAELESLAHALDRPDGRYVSRTCDAELGDARCGFRPRPSGLPGSRDRGGARSAVDASRSAGSTPSPPAGSRNGVLTWTTGVNVGRGERIDEHRRDAAGSTLVLRPDRRTVASAGDTFSVTAGCDKSFATCQAKFANAINFRGFPHLPGNDAAYGYVVDGGKFDGGADRAMRRTRVRCRRNRGQGGAVLARHALPAPGLAQGRRLRLPRAGARRLARRPWRASRTAGSLCAGLGRGAAARTLPRRREAAFPARSSAEDRLAGRPAAVSLAAASAGQACRHPRRARTASSTPTRAARCRCRRWCRNGGGASPASSRFPTPILDRSPLMATILLQAAGAAIGEPARPGRRCDRRGCGRARRLRDRPGADRRHAPHRRAAADGRAALHGGGGRGDPARLRHRARRRDLIWATRFEEASHDEPAGRQGRAEGYRIQLLRQRRVRALRGRDRRHQPRLGRRPRNRPRRDRDAGAIAARETQAPDPLIEAKQGAGNAPAYRGTAYVVFERFAARRLRQPHPAVPVRGAAAGRQPGRRTIRAVTLIPGATEFGLSPVAGDADSAAGDTEAVNRNVLFGETDLVGIARRTADAVPEPRSTSRWWSPGSATTCAPATAGSGRR